MIWYFVIAIIIGIITGYATILHLFNDLKIDFGDMVLISFLMLLVGGFWPGFMVLGCFTGIVYLMILSIKMIRKWKYDIIKS
jgi:hypothetical protein